MNIPLSKDDQRKVEELFERAVNLAPPTRDEFLENLEAPDGVRNEVRSLLNYEAQAKEKLETPLVRADAVIEGVEKILRDEEAGGDYDPQTVGPYAIIRKLGEGGMGSVYLAEQSEPLRRQVAIKIIKLGMDTKAVIDRFSAERQVLSLMNHPHVARALDAGATEDGRPYFVMDFVDGVRITEHCDRSTADVRSRLELFIGVCEAIQHAHQKGVIHRDIKPSNVLVCHEGGRTYPKVIDFGVAKATHDSSVDQTVTREGVVLGTPAYMSPEQAGAGSTDVDTRSDIYSLGVLLYELLIGARPTSATTTPGSSTRTSVEQILNQEPTKPSTRLSDPDVASRETAQRRGVDVFTLRRTIRGDLDWIVMKCLERERDRRYATVAELIADVNRYLRDQPVEAGPPSVFYRARKYVRRNRAFVVATVVVFVSLVSATTASSILYVDANSARQRALAQQQTAEQISSFVRGMLTSVDPRIARGRDVSVLRELIDNAAHRLDAGELKDPNIVSALRRTIGSAYHSIGADVEAERHLRLAVALQENASPQDPMELAKALSSLGNYLRQLSRFPEAEPLLRRSLEIRKTTLGESHLSTAEGMFDLALLNEQTGSPDTQQLYRNSLAIQEKLADGPTDLQARTLHALGVYLRNQGHMHDAERPFRKALAIQKEIHGADHPNVVPMQLGLGIWLRNVHRYREAEEQMLSALQICRDNFPTDHPETLNVTTNLAALYQDMRRFPEAERMYREALATQRRIYHGRHIDIATTANNLASLLATQDRMAEAKPLFKEAADMYREVLGSDHEWVSIPLTSLAYVQVSGGDIDEADKTANECLRIRQLHTTSENWKIGEVECILGAIALARNNLDSAEQLLTRSYKKLKTHYGPNARMVKYTRLKLVELYSSSNRPDEAKKWQ